MQTLNPATEQVIASYSLMDAQHVDGLIQQVSTAQQDWADSDFSIRKRTMMHLGQLLRESKDTYAKLITDEMGKPISQSIKEILKCADLCDFYAVHGEAFLQPELIKTEFQKSYRCFQALGVVFAIMPWNFPFWQVLRFAVPNLMAGNGAVLKHAPNCIGTSLAIEHLFAQAGFPKDLFHSLVIDLDLVPQVIHHPKIIGVTLTGSNRAGKSVAQEAGSALKKVVLELGGSDPYVVLEDADLELAAEQCVASRLSNCGQVCIAAKRMIVVESVQEEFEHLVLEKAKTYTMGNPLLAETMLGPMARKDLRDSVHAQVQRTIAAGARCILGGEIPKRTGFYYPATMLVNVTPDSPAFTEELFGPVICCTSAKNEAEAMSLANQSEFGLSAAIFTKDLARGERLAKDYMNVGTCAVNSLVASDPRLPFGGIKQSGYGRELAVEGMREFVNVKTVVVR
ncbi:MAG: NAD-dependent succinate-semialdehyde dehydrogenase [Legionella sp.]